MMKRSQASAPGKIILFGEHAVVYGRPAIAVPVADVRAQATLEVAPSNAGFRIVAPDLERDYLLVDAAPDDPLAKTVQITLEYLGQNHPPDATLHVTSTIPLGRGLGSGAAISAAIVRAMAEFFDQSVPTEAVSNLVYQVEKLYHGTPSGIDNTVISYEQPVYFIKGRPVQRLRVVNLFTLVIGDTGIVASTRKVVGGVRHRWQVDAQRYEGYFDEMSVIARHAKMIIEQQGMPVQALGKLMNENQELLENIGVSSPELEQLVKAARVAGAWGAKLSGAGGGGNMIALVPPQPDVVAAVSNALTEAGASAVFVTEVRQV